MAKSNDTALKMLSAALEMEEKGEAFYKKAMNECKSEPGREIWQMLMADEIIHKSRIRKLYDSIDAGKGWSEEWESDKTDTGKLDSFFKKMSEKHGQSIKAETSDLEAMDVGIDLELSAIKFYEKNLTKATDPIAREFLSHMVKEEHSHYRALSDMKFYLIDPVSWFRDKERSGLDGTT